MIRTLKEKLKNIKEQMYSFFKTNEAELVFAIGFLFIFRATYMLNFIAFLYVVGLVLIGFGFFLVKFPRKVR